MGRGGAVGPRVPTGGRPTVGGLLCGARREVAKRYGRVGQGRLRPLKTEPCIQTCRRSGRGVCGGGVAALRLSSGQERAGVQSGSGATRRCYHWGLGGAESISEVLV